MSLKELNELKKQIEISLLRTEHEQAEQLKQINNGKRYKWDFLIDRLLELSEYNEIVVTDIPMRALDGRLKSNEFLAFHIRTLCNERQILVITATENGDTLTYGYDLLECYEPYETTSHWKSYFDRQMHEIVENWSVHESSIVLLTKRLMFKNIVNRIEQAEKRQTEINRLKKIYC